MGTTLLARSDPPEPAWPLFPGSADSFTHPPSSSTVLAGRPWPVEGRGSCMSLPGSSHPPSRHRSIHHPGPLHSKPFHVQLTVRARASRTARQARAGSGCTAARGQAPARAPAAAAPSPGWVTSPGWEPVLRPGRRSVPGGAGAGAGHRAGTSIRAGGRSALRCGGGADSGESAPAFD